VTDIKVPDIGDFDEVPVIEILVEVGQEVAEEDPLVTLESDKATMDVPAPEAGKVAEILVSVGDKVSEGTPIVRLEGGDGAGTPEQEPEQAAEPKDEEPKDEEPKGDRVDLVVLGAGPGGYAAAFRAADLGLSVTLVERHERLGGVCLNVGCIPSKTLLHLAKVMAEAEDSAEHGIRFGAPEVDLDGVRGFKDGVVKQLTGGLDGLAKRRKVTVLHGEAQFTSDHELQVGDDTVAFEHAIIACGSTAATLPFLPEDERIMDSTDALELADVPKRLLVIGGGIIGLEMATVYDALGSEVTVAELQDQLIPGCDPDLVKPLAKRIEGRYAAIHLGTSVKEVKAQKKGLKVTFDGDVPDATFDRILVAVGRQPNGGGIGADAAGVEVDDRGFIAVDEQLRTNVRHILAIGDVVGEPMLAHKATHEGHTAAEVVAGHDVVFDAKAIPSVAYTDPEVAWMGLTETKAKADGIDYEKASFPWTASGRALTVGRPDGVTKLLVDPESRRILGAGLTGVNAGELIAELVHALEMGAVAEDVGLTVHPHPTLSETIGFAAEVAEGTITDIYAPRKRGKKV
jgi:dihydrolipoamide dehydrogenase